MSQSKYIQQSSRAAVRSYLQHHLNPLHFYCRLRDWGLSSRTASRLCTSYERLYKVVFRSSPEV